MYQSTPEKMKKKKKKQGNKKWYTRDKKQEKAHLCIIIYHSVFTCASLRFMLGNNLVVAKKFAQCPKNVYSEGEKIDPDKSMQIFIAKWYSKNVSTAKVCDGI